MDGKVLDTKQKEDVLVQIGNLSRKPTSLLKSIHDDVIRDQLGQRVTLDETEKKEKKANKTETQSEI